MMREGDDYYGWQATQSWQRVGQKEGFKQHSRVVQWTADQYSEGQCTPV